MRFSDVFSARAIAYRLTEDPTLAKPYLGEAFFPTKKKMGIDLKWIKAHKDVDMTLAPSSYDALSVIRPRGGFSVQTEEMPLFRESMKVSEHDEAEIMRALDSGDPYVQEVINHVYDDVATLVNGARIASERMRMSLIAPASGDIVISIGEKDNTIYNYNYDSGSTWKGTNYLPLLGGAQWDQTSTAKPLNDIQTAVDALADKGYVAKYAMMNTVTLNLLVDSQQMQKALITITGNPVDFLDRKSAMEVFERRTGLIPIIYDKKYKDYDGTSKKFYPDYYVSVIGDDVLGSTWYGVTPEERTLLGDSKVDVSVLDSGIAIAVQNIYGPPVRHDTTVSQIALPSFEGMDALYVIKVK